MITQLLCFESNNIFQQASKPSYSVKIKYKTRLGRVRCRRHPRMKSNHAMPHCIHRAILEITDAFARLQHHYIANKKKSKEYIIFAREPILQNH
jgi:hypothetical protein